LEVFHEKWETFENIPEPKSTFPAIFSTNSEEYTENLLREVFKDAAKSGRLSAAELVNMTKKYTDSIIDSYSFTDEQLDLYNKVNLKAMNMLEKDLSRYFNEQAHQMQTRKTFRIIRRPLKQLHSQNKHQMDLKLSEHIPYSS
jgi:hypothetical protein